MDRFWHRLELELTVSSDLLSTFSHIIDVSDGGQLAEDRLSAVDRNTAVFFSVGGGTEDADCDRGSEVMAV